MHYIVVCDDDKCRVSRMKKFLNRIKDQNHNQFEIYKYDLEGNLIGGSDELKEVLARAEKNAGRKFVIGHYRNNVIRVDIRHILYVENAKRGSRIIVCPGCDEAKFSEPILVDDKLEILSDKFHELALAHRSHLINVTHIVKIADNEAYLDDGTRLPVSRKYKQNFLNVFTDVIVEKY